MGDKVYIVTREMQGHGCAVKDVHGSPSGGLSAIKELFELDKTRYRNSQYSFPDWSEEDEDSLVQSGSTTWRQTGMGILYYGLLEFQVQP